MACMNSYSISQHIKMTANHYHLNGNSKTSHINNVKLPCSVCDNDSINITSLELCSSSPACQQTHVEEASQPDHSGHDQAKLSSPPCESVYKVYPELWRKNLRGKTCSSLWRLSCLCKFQVKTRESSTHSKEMYTSYQIQYIKIL